MADYANRRTLRADPDFHVVMLRKRRRRFFFLHRKIDAIHEVLKRYRGYKLTPAEQAERDALNAAEADCWKALSAL